MRNASAGRAAAIAAAVVFLAAVAASGSRAASVVPKAIYSSAQAATGSKAYAANCASCHGANLEGGAGPALSGENLKTLSRNTHLTVHDLFTFMSQQMPMNAPASLAKDQYAAIMAYVLKYNGYPAGAKPLTYAAASSSTMPITSLK